MPSWMKAWHDVGPERALQRMFDRAGGGKQLRRRFNDKNVGLAPLLLGRKIG